VFANPPGDSAGRLIEACGLKGARIGGAVVSDKHANFIQAESGATADDVAALIVRVATEVAQQTGVELRPEVQLVGITRPDFGGTGGSDHEHPRPPDDQVRT
jgi:UDP-N-acetylmuramate dehydrogenase